MASQWVHEDPVEGDRAQLAAVRGIFALQVVVRLSLGIDASKNVAMKLAVRSSSEEISEVIHQIIQNA